MSDKVQVDDRPRPMIRTRRQLEKAIGHNAERIVEELGFPWVDLPAEIAADAVFRLCYELADRFPKGRETTLHDLGVILEVWDKDGSVL